jgi:hypothetical protein
MYLLIYDLRPRPVRIRKSFVLGELEAALKYDGYHARCSSIYTKLSLLEGRSIVWKLT